MESSLGEIQDEGLWKLVFSLSDGMNISKFVISIRQSIREDFVLAKKYRMKKRICLLSLGVAMSYSCLAYGEEAVNPTIPVTPAASSTMVEMSADTQGPVGQKITEVSLEGVHNVDVQSIMELIGSHPGDIWTAEQSNKDVQAILGSGYFQAARLKYDLVPEGTRIVYEVKENPAFKGLSLTGNTIYKAEELQSLATVTPGVIINTNRLTGDLQAIEDFYKKNGYVLARLADVKVAEDGTVSARVIEGVIESISITGNKKTKDRTIRREVKVKVGEPLQAEDARNTIRRLNNLGIFEDVKMDLQPGREPNQYVYALDVKEAPSRSVALGGGYNQDDGFSMSLEFADKNFLGINDQVKLRYEFGGEGDTSDKFRHGFEIGYVHPWLTSHQMSVSFNMYDLLRRKADRDEDGDEISEFDQEIKGYDITFTQPYGEYKKAFLGFGVRETKYRDPVSGWNYETIPGYIDSNFGKYASVNLGFIYDDRDSYFVPTRGKRLSVSVSQGVQVFGGDFDYTQFNLDARKYWPIQVGKAEHTVAFRLLGGIQMGGNVPESELLSVGGDTVMRGFENDQFRGTKMVAATLEYRVPVHKYVSLVAFGEVGDAWDASDNAIFSYPNRGFEVRTSYGLGVRLNTPLGPIRLDYGIGNGQDDGRFSFGFGASF